MSCRGALAAAVFGPAPAAWYPCGTLSSLRGQRGEKVFHRSRDAGEQMNMIQEDEPEVLPVVATSPGKCWPCACGTGAGGTGVCCCGDSWTWGPSGHVVACAGAGFIPMLGLLH